MAGPTPKPGIDRIRPHMVPAAGGDAPPEILLHSNESAFGPSPRAVAAARAAIDGIERYVEFQDHLLGPAIAAAYGLDPDWIAVGQGSDDLLARLGRAYLGPGTELVRTANGYLKVPNYAHANGAEVVSVPDRDFVTSVDALLAAVNGRARMVYVANPENPAGTCLPAAELKRLRDGLPGDVLLVIDAAYEEYVDAPGHGDTASLVRGTRNVVMCRTFSKVHGLAGARVGWIHAHPDIVDPVRRIGLTFPISTPSLRAAMASLEDPAHTGRVAAETIRLRGWLTGELAAMGLAVTPSQANFVLVGFPDPARTAADAAAALSRRGIAVRRFASPAYDRHLRITIGRERELRAALEAIRQFLDGAA